MIRRLTAALLVSLLLWPCALRAKERSKGLEKLLARYRKKRRPPCPHLAVDVIILMPGGGIVVIERRNPPHGWALPGGFVDYGESVERAAVREAKEETDLDVSLVRQLHTYSAPDRDPRRHVVSVAFLAKALGRPKGRDDAKRARIVDPRRLPKMAFDHAKIVSDWLDKTHSPRRSRRRRRKD